MKNYELLRDKEMKRHLVIILATVFVILGVALLIVHLHRENKMEILSQFQDHQIGHAQHLAHQIEFFFRARSEELQALSSLVSREDGDLRKKTADIETYSKMIEYVKAISLYNGSGTIVYTTDSNPIGLDHAIENSFLGQRRRRTKEKSLVRSCFKVTRLCFSLRSPFIKIPSMQTIPNGVANLSVYSLLLLI